jgi:hypothetical protein
MQNSIGKLSWAVAIILWTSCSKPDTVGLNVLPGDDAINVEFFDTLTLNTTYMQEDSLRTDAHLLYELQATNHQFMVGKYVDPVFGESSAELFSQLKPAATFSNTNRNYDSLILNLAYIANYGDTTVDQTFEIYELSETMYDTASYYAFSNLAYSSKIGEITFKVQDINDSIPTSDSTKIAPRIRIKLDDALGQRIFNEAGTYLNEISNFKNQVKGICIKPAASSVGSIINFDAKTTASCMVMYYGDAATTGLDSLPFYFYSSDGTIARFSRFTHDYSSFDFNNPEKDKTYIQTMGGIKTKITIPYLESLKQLGPIAINKAELVINIQPGTTSVYDANPALNLYAIDSVGDIQTMPDLTRSATLFGGSLNNNQYRFNIAQFLQQILYEKRKDYGMFLRIRIPVAFQTPNRVILAGGDPVSPLRMKLQITYTKLNP